RMTLLAGVNLTEIQATLTTLGLDGWLLFDFRSLNPVTKRIVGDYGMGSRRLFVLIPKQGKPVALVHKIELQPFLDFPGEVRPYAKWEELHHALGAMVKGKRIAMEISPQDAVPYLDRVPYGVIELIAKLGGTVMPSGGLVTKFASAWSAEELANHLYA